MEENRMLDMTGFQTLTDSELVRLAKDVDPRAFGELVNRYQARMYRLARRLTDSQEDAEDVLQEAFTRRIQRQFQVLDLVVPDNRELCCHETQGPQVKCRFS